MHLLRCLTSALVLITSYPVSARPIVAVIDSGIARTPALAAVLKSEYDMAATPARAPFKPQYDHGTMVATILNHAAGGQVDIISLRIDDMHGCPVGDLPPCQSSPKPVADAIDRAVQLGANVINLSLALANDPLIVAAVSRATHEGVTVVMAAGNKGRDYPDNVAMARSGFPRAVLVGAVGADGKPWSGTNRPEPHETEYTYVWQPGVDVPTVNASGAEVRATGTSFAVPVEAAHRALAEGSAIAEMASDSSTG
ncbi:S8 family peptidase [Sphingobium sp. SCG-1]|uniref:S8 family peptidase n=1 Tax=Sphingobium sp. SCG-1 TaxID=2072936 RepID=UPI00166FE44C|nr:S8 family serine peptidase [Sphingobium sp. SCG-1]